MPTPPMGGINPQNLQAMAAAGEPQAIAMLRALAAQQGGGAPQGMPPPGAVPPQGAPPQGAPPMSQSQFGNGGPVPPDVQARRAQQLIQMLRMRGG